MNDLNKYGFDGHFISEYQNYENERAVYPARVTAQMGKVYTLLGEAGTVNAIVMGKYIHNTKGTKDFPVVGDFVVARNIPGTDQAEIIQLLNRKTEFSRKMPISGGRKLHKGVIDGGVTEEQVLASNVDQVMILCGVDSNFNVARLERYLLLAKRAGIPALIVLTKIDLNPAYELMMEKALEISAVEQILSISAITGEGLEQLDSYLQPGATIALLGSSGAGKSTLLNALFNESVQKTNITSQHSGKGKHTTTHRQMFFHSSGCMIIDTPGIKELQLWADEDDLELIYPDIIEWEQSCKYKNCSHRSEAGCMITDKIESGELSREKYERYLKMKTELKRLSERKLAHKASMGKKSKNNVKSMKRGH